MPLSDSSPRSVPRVAPDRASRLRRKAQRGFSLTELVVVMGIIGTLSGITLTAVAKGKAQSKLTVAKKETRDLVEAIHSYRDTYGRLPVSRQAAKPTFCGGLPLPPRDFTYGTVGPNGRGLLVSPQGRTLPSVISQTTALIPLDYQANNSEIISILMGLEYYRTTGTPQTVNWGNIYNPQRIQFFQPRESSGVSSPGVGDDLVYRDPWGNPYIVTLDLDYDGNSWDSFYTFAHVSERPSPEEDSQNGLVGLRRPNAPPYSAPATAHPSTRHNFMEKGDVMVWSFGPDGDADFNLKDLPDGKANKGKNKDNVLSW